MKSGFSKHFSRVRIQHRVLTPLKSASKIRISSFVPPSQSSFGKHKVYPSQTKILEGGTKEEIRIFEALFKGVSTRFGLRTIEKSIENPDFLFCSSFQNLRLGSIKLSWTDASSCFNLDSKDTSSCYHLLVTRVYAPPYENFGRSNEPKDGSMLTLKRFFKCVSTGYK